MTEPASRLIVNVSQVAHLRQTVMAAGPDPVHFALQAELAGAGGVSAHLRLDHRHIQEDDVELLVRLIRRRLFLHLSPNQDVTHLVNQWCPGNLVFVPERRDETTTENGIDVAMLSTQLAKLARDIDQHQTRIFALVEPALDQIRAAAKLEFFGVLINVRDYVLTDPGTFAERRFSEIADAARLASKFKLECHLANGVTWHHMARLSEIPGVKGIHVGHDLVARSLFIGIKPAMADFLAQIRPFRN